MDDAKTLARRQIIEVAAEILEAHGAHAVSTRSVASAAGIRAASLYQHFRDKDGLLEALAIHGFDLYLADKQALAHTDDPIADMRRGWDTHVDFGLHHPALYLLMYGTNRPECRPPAAERAGSLLMKFLDRTAAAGHLRVLPSVAAQLCLAAVTGVTLSLIGTPTQQRDMKISPRMRDTLIDSLITDPAPAEDRSLAARALSLDAAITTAAPGTLPLRPAETTLLRDWLDQLAR
ncbi:TetR/AcrR family transcriptional regulator [Nocardia sp. CA2R105]|uniref:TetR/AcrR family transcriptional regulator n=1 Tax=Nocardia coffeae TaxID=2873381 RepID=UPI001CA67025|nr:TetR/AcrR family transcriptional regulator [Nocardia coffeae]MBY8860346.1 TetR/AcrR family transcriptional regulator [Nocardia coffeae]